MAPSKYRSKKELTPGREKALLNEEEKGLYIRETINSPGWKILDEMARDELVGLQKRIDESNDTDEVFACTKRKSGILFFIEQASKLINEGNKATKTLLHNKPE